jgi:hypothetical protein
MGPFRPPHHGMRCSLTGSRLVRSVSVPRRPTLCREYLRRSSLGCGLALPRPLLLSLFGFRAFFIDTHTHTSPTSPPPSQAHPGCLALPTKLVLPLPLIFINLSSIMVRSFPLLVLPSTTQHNTNATWHLPDPLGGLLGSFPRFPPSFPHNSTHRATTT